MSRFTLGLALVLSLTSVASAKRLVESPFAQPPTEAHTEVLTPADRPEPAGYRIAPPVLNRAQIRAALVNARAKNLAAFRAYQKAGVFPSNSFSSNKLNVWVDADGHFCAAATIIKASGQSDLVTRTGEQNNFIRLADVEQGPLMDWIMTSGFTQAEISAIQEPMMPVVRDVPRPAEPILVDAKLRKAENQRLRRVYASVERMLVRNQKKSLELATTALMRHPLLARQFVAANS